MERIAKVTRTIIILGIFALSLVAGVGITQSDSSTAATRENQEWAIWLLQIVLIGIGVGAILSFAWWWWLVQQYIESGNKKMEALAESTKTAYVLAQAVDRNSKAVSTMASELKGAIDAEAVELRQLHASIDRLAQEKGGNR